jgi:AraC-like DNA-binding protein
MQITNALTVQAVVSFSFYYKATAPFLLGTPVIQSSFLSAATIIHMRLYIKNMVSLRCKMVIRNVLQKWGLHHSNIDLGEIEILEDISERERKKLAEDLLKYDLELLDNKKQILIERINTLIIEMIQCSDELPATNYSTYISSKLKYDYTYLSNLFSEMKGITIRQYIIIYKIEKVKELLTYDELSLTEIADKLHYSSVAHLANQFKKTTGISPKLFKKLKQNRRLNLAKQAG